MQEISWKIFEESFRIHFIQGGSGKTDETKAFPWSSLPCSLAVHIKDGEIKYEFQDSGDMITLSGDAVLFIPPNVIHRRWRTPNPDIEMQVHWLHFQGSVCGGMDIFTMIKEPIFFRSHVPLQRSISNLIDIHKRHADKPSFPSLVTQQRLCLEIAEALLQRKNPEESLYSSLAQINRLMPVIQYFEDHINEPLNRQKVSKLMNLSMSRCDKLFKSIFGVGPTDYLINYRLEKAKLQLLSTSLSIAEIANKLGYEDPYYFSRLFKKRIGHSPSHYRELVQNV